MIYGIDNGVTGAITVIYDNRKVIHHAIPIKKELSYTKKKQWITRIDYEALHTFLKKTKRERCFCLLERPMVNPIRFKASMSALRALEATIIALEVNNIPFMYLDSKSWQKVMLPKGLKKEELKKGAMLVAKRLFPDITIINADSLLIAEYGRKMKIA